MSFRPQSVAYGGALLDLYERLGLSLRYFGMLVWLWNHSTEGTPCNS